MYFIFVHRACSQDGPWHTSSHVSGSLRPSSPSPCVRCHHITLKTESKDTISFNMSSVVVAPLSSRHCGDDVIRSSKQTVNDEELL